MPLWVITLEIASEWKMPPWQVEDELSKEWYDRYLAHRIAQAEVHKSKDKTTAQSANARTWSVKE